MTERKRARAKSTPPHIPGSPIAVLVWLNEELHAEAKKAAKIDRRALNAFCVVAIEEKIARMQETDIDSPGFIPPGLRR